MSTIVLLILLFSSNIPNCKDIDIERKHDAIVIKEPKEKIYYDFGNQYIMAKADSTLNINKYWVVNIAPSILVEDSWKTIITINNKGLKNPKTTVARSNLFLNKYISDNMKVDVTTYVDNSTNAIFQKYDFAPFNDENSSIDITYSFSFGLGINEEDLIINYYVTENAYSFITNNSDDKYSGIFSSNLQPYNYNITGNKLNVSYHIDCRKSNKSFYIFLSGGYSREKEEKLLQKISNNWNNSYIKAITRADWIDNMFDSDDRLLDQMFSACIDCALSNFKSDNTINFNAFYAGVRYKEPARTYFRDSYWTSQSILPFKSGLIRKQIIALSKGIHDDGSCGSGVKFDGSDWWSNHYDSPSFFIMMIYDYIIWTGDESILEEKTLGKARDDGKGNIELSKEKTIWAKAKKVLEWLENTDTNNNGLIQKPQNSFGDWADEVARVNEVTYVNALYYRALNSMSYLAKLTKEFDISRYYKEKARNVKKAINRHLWDNNKKHYVDFITTDNSGKILYKEDHFMEDTFTALLYGVANDIQINSSLNYARNWLESRNNFVQPYGDWGTLCIWPLYKETTYRRPRESDDPYRYHNGADWPYLDGLNALTRLIFNDPYWEYPLTKWWKESIKKNWLTPVEYFQPVYPEGGFRQAWSSMPAAAIVMGGFGFAPHLIKNTHIKTPPFINASIKGLKYKRHNYDILYKNKKITIYQDGKQIENQNIF
jgi:hypothetical protein